MTGGTRRRRPYSHWDERGRPKVPYTRLERAMAVARRQARHHGWPQDVYVCRRCASWHHGTGSIHREPAAGIVRVWPDGEAVAGV